MDHKFIPYLTELAAKYSVADNVQVELEEGAIKVSCDKGSYRFFYDFGKALPQDGFVNVPLYHWQLKRRYVELRNILDTEMVKNALAMRIHHIVSPDEFTRSLKDIIVFETNLVEFVTHQRIEKVFSDFSGDVYANCILSTDGNVKVSMELGFSPEGSQPVLLHEIIGKNGLACDVVVDTQTQQYPIYVFKGKETLTYTDIDAELYDMENTQVDSVRSAVLRRCAKTMHTSRMAMRPRWQPTPVSVTPKWRVKYETGEFGNFLSDPCPRAQILCDAGFQRQAELGRRLLRQRGRGRGLQALWLRYSHLHVHRADAQGAS